VEEEGINKNQQRQSIINNKRDNRDNREREKERETETERQRQREREVTVSPHKEAYKRSWTR